MGIFDFGKSVGEALFGSNETDNKEREAKIQTYVKSLDLKVEDLETDVDGSNVSIKGTCPSPADREKLILAVGNVEGIEKVDDKIEVEKKVESQSEPTFYTVKSGDTLSKISQKYYDDPAKYDVIFQANRPMLKDPNEIYPGQALRIPNTESQVRA